jgi:4-amino-4-deoxy-L-arabinose transferase-like glycosyltransferase
LFIYNAPALRGNRLPNPDRGKKSWIALAVILAGFLAGTLYSFLLFPSVSTTYESKLDPDLYGLLGRNVYAGDGLAYSLEEGPTVFRGPLYPAFIALCLHLTGGWYPGGVWIGQSLLHGLTCWLIFLTALGLWDRKTAFMAALIYAFYPVVLWQVPRMWNETLLAFLAAALIYLGLAYLRKPACLKAAGVGAVLGLLSLTKGVFLPFFILFPLILLLVGRPRIIRDSVLMAMVATLLITPWSVRNWRLSGEFIPVHVGLGGNLKRGNLMAREFFGHPLSYKELFEKTNPEMSRIKHSVQGAQFERDIATDRLMKASALQDIRRNPILVFTKAVSAGLMFWFVGDTSAKTLVLLALRLPILLLFAAAALGGLRTGRTQLWPAVSFVTAFWMLNLPFAPNARISVPLMPILVMFAAATACRIPLLRRKQAC